MGQALEVIETLPSRLDVPKGSSARQVRLARAILLRSPDDSSTWTDILKDAGYADSTIRSDALAIREAPGVKRATAALAVTLADKARGYAGISQRALKDAHDDLAALHPAQRLEAAIKFAELAHTVGENVEATGDGDAWKRKLETIAARALIRGFKAAVVGRSLADCLRRHPQHVVLSPPTQVTSTE